MHDTAGAGSPAPAVLSAASVPTPDAVPHLPADPTARPGAPAADAGRPASADVVAPTARAELDRIRRRWGELSLAQAEGRMPLLRHLLADLATRSAAGLLAHRPPGEPSGVRPQVAGSQQIGGGEVPDLGPAVVVDQLTVLVWDAYAGGRGDGIPDLLTELRRHLA